MAALYYPGTVKVRIEVIRPPLAEGLEVGTLKPAPPVVELFAVQVGVFSDRGNAERLRQSLERKYGAAKLVAREGSRVQWRVLAGREETEEGAAALAERIRADGLSADAFVVRLDESAEKPAQDPAPLGSKLEEQPRQ